MNQIQAMDYLNFIELYFTKILKNKNEEYVLYKCRRNLFDKNKRVINVECTKNKII